jgi:acyl carrier protein
MAEFDDIRQLIGELLHLGDQVKKWHPDTALVGSIPEFDSMAVVALIQALEERFGIQISDDEISAETFETIGRVYELVSIQGRSSSDQRWHSRSHRCRRRCRRNSASRN